MSFFKKDPLKMIAEIEKDANAIAEKVVGLEKIRRSRLLDQEIEPTEQGALDLSKLDNELLSLKATLQRKREMVAEVKERNATAIAKKQRDEYVQKVRTVREFKPKAIEHFQNCEKYLQLAIDEWMSGRELAQKALSVGLETDGSSSGSLLNDQYLFDSLKLAIVKCGWNKEEKLYKVPQVRALRAWVGDPNKIPDIHHHLEGGFDHLLKFHKDVE